MDPLIGKTLSHYRIVEKIGAGGMGVVYRARDERLERDVALKVLPSGALVDEPSRKKFRKEALALSKLNHPNIATVHDFDSQAGVDFLVMEFVEGETLVERLARGPLPEQEVARVGEQMADGLGAAHRAGVLHRDVKPANLRVTPEGRLKILDFGLARIVRVEGDRATVTATETGAMLGTVPYMAPEQLRGERLDERTDVWAAGAVLYELSTGQRPFASETQAQLITAILHGAPPKPRQLKANLSPELERIALRCLEKAPEHRYQTAGDLAADLRRSQAPSLAGGGQRLRARWQATPRSLRLGGIVAAMVVAVALFALDVGGLRQRLAPTGFAAEASLAVLPLANLSGDPAQEYFADGMTDELITRLAQVSSLNVISRTSSMPYKGARKPLKTIGRELGVGLVVEGTVARSGDMVRISARLVDVATNRPIWADSYERTLSNALALQSEVARGIVEKVRVRVTREERARLANTPQVDPNAHEAYLRGRASFLYGNGREVVEWYQRAIAADPGYAAAYAGLGEVYAWMSPGLSAHEAMPRARAAAKKALEIDPNLAQAYATLGYVKMVYDFDREGAERDFRRALALNPRDLSALQNYGLHLLALGRFDEAAKQFGLARAVDPLSRVTASMSVWPLFEGRRYIEAIAAARTLIAADPDPSNVNPRIVLGQALFFSGAQAEGIEEMRKISEQLPEVPFMTAWLGYLYARSGDRSRALKIWGRLKEMEKRQYVQPYLFAIVRIGLGQRAEALDLLEQALRERSDELIFAKVDPALDPLRGEPRFKAILKELRFL